MNPLPERPITISISACVVACNIAVASMPAAGWPDWWFPGPREPTPRSNGEFHARATRKPKFQLVAYDESAKQVACSGPRGVRGGCM